MWNRDGSGGEAYRAGPTPAMPLQPNGGMMQTIEEYKAYTLQLENEVGKWHHAYDALMVERNQLVNRLMELERKNKTTED